MPKVGDPLLPVVSSRLLNSIYTLNFSPLF
jgi:hypothetical protein